MLFKYYNVTIIKGLYFLKNESINLGSHHEFEKQINYPIIVNYFLTFLTVSTILIGKHDEQEQKSPPRIEAPILYR